MKKYQYAIIFMVLIAGLVSCEKKNDDNENINSKSTITHITDQDVLSNRIVTVNQPVEFKGVGANQLNFVHKWNITPNVINGKTLSASSSLLGDDMLFAGWHTRGDDVQGELMVIDFQSIYANNPIITESFEFVDQEINDLSYGTDFDSQESYVLAAGKAKRDFSGEYNSINQAMVFSVLCDKETNTIDFNSAQSWQKYLPAFSANSVYYDSQIDDVIVSTGSNGGLSVFNKNDHNNLVFNAEISDSKHYDRHGRFAAFLSGDGPDQSKLYVWDYNNSNINYEDYTEYSIPFGVTSEGKNVVNIDRRNWEYANLAMGKYGLVRVNLTSGEIVNRFHTENGGHCNGVASDYNGMYLFVAYGSEGLYILDKNTFEVLGNWNYDGSCNYVEQFGPYLLIANGNTEGLILLEHIP